MKLNLNLSDPDKIGRLTKARALVLKSIVAHSYHPEYEKKGIHYFSSREDIQERVCKSVGIKRPTFFDHFKVLVKDGYLLKGPGKGLYVINNGLIEVE